MKRYWTPVLYDTPPIVEPETSWLVHKENDVFHEIAQIRAKLTKYENLLVRFAMAKRDFAYYRLDESDEQAWKERYRMLVEAEESILAEFPAQTEMVS